MRAGQQTRINVIADVAGRFDELTKLVAKMPAADLILSVGDMVDRGPKSKQVLEWFMADPIGRQAVHANHENMLLDAAINYPGALHEHPYYFYNGGGATLDSYNYAPIPEAHLQWLETRPMWYRADGLFVSHAPVADVTRIPPEFDDWRKFVDDESSWPWNRYLSKRPMKDHFMVFGHNARYTEHRYVDDDGQLIHFATCLDDSSAKRLCGMAWPSREIFSVPYA